MWSAIAQGTNRDAVASKTFIEKTRNYVSLILSRSKSAEEFATKMKALARHVRDEHEVGVTSTNFEYAAVMSVRMERI